jgi:hypothetical protein
MSFVQGAHNSVSASSASLTATFGAGVTSGNTVWGIVAWNATSGAPTSVTVGGVAATLLDTINDVADAASATTFILGNVSGAPTSVVANFSPNQAFISIVAIEESGCLAASNPTDVHTGRLQASPGTGADIINSGNVTTTVASDIIVGAYCDAVGSTVGTAGTTPLAFTLRTTDAVAGEPVATEDGVVLVTPGTAAATFGQTANNSAISFVIAIKPTAAAGAIDVPSSFRSRQIPPRWNLNSSLLLGVAQGVSSSAVETNTHFIPRAFPPQWSLNPFLLHNRRAGPESSSAIETNPHWQGRTWKSQWNINDSPNLLWNSAGDVPAATTADDPTYFVYRTWPRQWNINLALKQNTAQDFSSSAVETNPQWRNQAYPPQWSLNTAFWRTVPQDFISPAVETNPQWPGKPWPAAWILNRALWQGTAQDSSSSAVETNVHFVPHQWLVQWLPTKALWQNAATDAQTVVIPPDAPTYFTPVQFPWQWVINLLLTTSPANDLTSPAVETNPHWTGRAYPNQWQAQPSLRQNPAMDVPPVVDASSYFVTRYWPAQSNINRSLGWNTANDFSSSAVQTDTSYFRPRTWAVQWAVNISLARGTAQDFSSVAPVVTSRPRVYIYT